MELSTQTSTESKKGNESGKGIAGEKMKCPADNLLLTYSKRKRKKKGQKSSTHEENVLISPEIARCSTSQPENLVQNPTKPPTGVRKNVPSMDQSMPASERENIPNVTGKSVRKGRNAKKKAAAAAAVGAAVVVGEVKHQVSEEVPAIKNLHARGSPKWTPPKQAMMSGLPAGLQPMNFIRKSSSPAVQSPKQEKFTPYWSTKEVETGLASGSLFSGIIRINPRNYQKSYISPGNDDDGKDVLIDGIIDRNRALEGDEVAVKLYDESKWQVEENALGEPVVQKTGMVVSILAKNHTRRTVGYLKLVHKTKSTPKKNGKGDGRENNTIPGVCLSPLQRELFPSPCTSKEANSVPCSSSNHNSVTLLPAIDKQANVIPNMRTCEQLEQGLTLNDNSNQQIKLKPEDINAFASHVMQMGTYQYPHPMGSPFAQPYPNSSGNPANIPPFIGSAGQMSPYAESTDKLHPFGGEQRLPFTQASNQRIQNPQQMPSSVPTDSPVEVPGSPAEAKREPFKMPERVLFSPRDARMPRMWVKTSCLPSGTPVDLSPSNCQNHLFLACVHEWNELPIANGNLLAYVGEADEVDSETAALLLEHDLDVTPYPENIFTLPPLPFQIPQKELDERLDLRKMCIFTIDPATAKDLDDALSVREICDGLLEVGVHIADPTFFLEEDSPLDLCVRQRATSIYLVQNVFHMLPKDLCLLCSLLPGEDKLAFSLLMEVDSTSWKVVSHKFSRSIINSCAQLSYEHAQAFMDDPNCDWSTVEDFPAVHNGYTISDLCRCVNMLRPFSAVLRERRFAYKNKEEYDDEEEDGTVGGALKINQPKLCFKLDYATLMPQDVFVYENKESHRLIEELMLTANILTAQRLASMFPEHAFLRRHSRPKMKLLTNLAQELTHYGIHLDISAAGALNASLKQYGPNDPEDVGMVDCCDDPDDNSTDIMMAENEKQAETGRTVPNSNEGFSEQSCKKELEDEKERSISLENLSSELQQESSSDLENVAVSVCGVTAVEESLSDLKIEGDMVECETSAATYVATPNIGENNTPDSEIKNLPIAMSSEKGVVSLDASKDQRKKRVKNNLSRLLMRNSQSDEDLAIARGLVLNHLCAKPMVRADYYCLGASVEKTANKDMKWKIEGDPSRDGGEVEVYTHHYALNVPLYTHFTSPIRRYADIMVHRLLAASLGYAPIPDNNPLDFQKIATNCNKQNMGAKRASEASNELFFRLWVRLQVEQENLKAKEGGGRTMALLHDEKNADTDENRSEGGIREVAVVVNAKDYSFHAILLRFGVLVRVYVNKLPATTRSYKKQGTSTISIRWHLPGKNAVTRDSPKQDITMFSLVDLAIYYSYSARRIRAELLSPFANLNNGT